MKDISHSGELFEMVSKLMITVSYWTGWMSKKGT